MIAPSACSVGSGATGGSLVSERGDFPADFMDCNKCREGHEVVRETMNLDLLYGSGPGH